MYQCECVHWRGSGGALLMSEFTVLIACRKNLHFSLLGGLEFPQLPEVLEALLRVPDTRLTE